MPDIGIIGGADGPTAILITSSEDFFIWLAAGIAITCAVFFLLWKRKQK